MQIEFVRCCHTDLLSFFLTEKKPCKNECSKKEIFQCDFFGPDADVCNASKYNMFAILFISFQIRVNFLFIKTVIKSVYITFWCNNNILSRYKWCVFRVANGTKEKCKTSDATACTAEDKRSAFRKVYGKWSLDNNERLCNLSLCGGPFPFVSFIRANVYFHSHKRQCDSPHKSKN